MGKLAVVVPTVEGREETFAGFIEAWEPLFALHEVEFVKVTDGENPKITHKDTEMDQTEVMGEYKDCLSNFNGGIRNLGFAYVAKYLPDVEVVMTLDDDTRPVGDTIQDHLDILAKKVPISWMSTASEYMRGFPYWLREEAEVVLSHGVWDNVADWDAPTQLVLGSHRPVTFPKMPIPKGIYYPMCGMNIAFKRKMLPHMYQAPFWLEQGLGRLDDILCGIYSKKEIDKQGWAAVTGYARVFHERASNVYKNLRLEAASIELFEEVSQGKEDQEYMQKIYFPKLARWQEFVGKNG
jgi:reversibly glycosylated polypeptide/UDP-arabinopyranose mutase